MHELIMKMTDSRILGVFLTATVIITIALWRIDAGLAGPGGAGVVQLELSFSQNGFASVLASWGGAGRELFMATRWIHFAYPLCYSVLLSTLPLYFLKRVHAGGAAFRNRKEILFFLLPYIAALLDYGASGLTVWLLRGAPASEGFIRVTAILAGGKWGLIILSLVYILARYFSIKKEMLRNSAGPA